MFVNENLTPCDWLTQFSKRVLQYRLGYSKGVKVVYRSVHLCTSSRHKVVLRRNLMMIITIKMINFLDISADSKHF